jgi:hypothetical protein
MEPGRGPGLVPPCTGLLPFSLRTPYSVKCPKIILGLTPLGYPFNAVPDEDGGRSP